MSSGQLKYLMKIFGISNRDLASLLQVDTSLVSKWRNGKRNIKSDVRYVKKAASYIVELDRKREYKRVKELLSKEYDIADSCSKEELSLYLVDWLLNPKKSEGKELILENMSKSKRLSRVEQTYYWEGNEGRREAVKYFLQYANACNSENEIIFYSTESVRWFHEDEEWLELWAGLSSNFMKNGNMMHIIHAANHSYSDIAASVLRWLPLHIKYGVKGYYHKLFDEEEEVNITIYSLKNEIVIFSISSNIMDTKCKTWLIPASELAKQFERAATIFTKNSIPLFRRHILGAEKKEREFEESLFSIYEKGGHCYSYNNFGEMIPAGKENYRFILENAGVVGKELEQSLLKFETMDSLKKQCECYFFIDIEILKLWIRQEYVKLDLFSLIAGTELHVGQDLYKNMILNFLESALKCDTVHLCLVDQKTHNEIGMLSLCSGGKYVHTFAASYETNEIMALDITEYTIAMALNQRLRQIWRSTSHLMKNKKEVVNYIKKELQEYMDME